MLANLGNIMKSTIDDSGAKYNAFIDSLQTAYSTVQQNRQELAPQTSQAAINSVSDEGIGDDKLDEDEED